jgi:hypothetical protein
MVNYKLAASADQDVELVPMQVIREFLRNENQVRVSFFTNISYPLINMIRAGYKQNTTHKNHSKLSALYWLALEGKVRHWKLKEYCLPEEGRVE